MARRSKTELKQWVQDYLAMTMDNVFYALADETVDIPKGFTREDYEREAKKQINRVHKLFGITELYELDPKPKVDPEYNGVFKKMEEKHV